jgi:Virulence activator alpha C-term
MAQERGSVVESGQPDQPLVALAVREWLDAPEAASDPDRSIFMLKFFFGSQAGRDHLLAQLQTFRDLYARRLETYEVKRASIEAAASRDPFTYRALLYGIVRARASIEWADETLATLVALPGRPSPPRPRVPSPAWRSSSSR